MTWALCGTCYPWEGRVPWEGVALWEKAMLGRRQKKALLGERLCLGQWSEREGWCQKL